MTRAPFLAAALALGLLAAPSALAQDDPGDAPRPESLEELSPPGWAGIFADDLIVVEVRPAEGGFEGTIRVAESSYPASGTISMRGVSTFLEGLFEASGKQMPFKLKVDEGADQVELETSGVTYVLTRQPDEVIGIERGGVPPPDEGATSEGRDQQAPETERSTDEGATSEGRDQGVSDTPVDPLLDRERGAPPASDEQGGEL